MQRRTGVAVWAVLLASAVVVGCQTYVFEPITPVTLARAQAHSKTFGSSFKPNVMLLVDKSGSMNFPIDANAFNCQGPGGVPCGDKNDPGNKTCPNDCLTRWGTLQNAVGNFLDTHQRLARWGLTFFPDPLINQAAHFCDPPARSVIPIPDVADTDPALAASAQGIKVAILNVSEAASPVNPDGGFGGTGGGTPTGNSILYARTDPAFAIAAAQKRSNFVILLTDGLPNCNASNPHDGDVDLATCHCTERECTSSINHKTGCLDQDATVAAIGNLSDAGVTTVVLGFGADVGAAGSASALQAMAVAGGFARRCNADGSPCANSDEACLTDGKLCTRQFFQASNGQELGAALTAIAIGFVPQTPCRIPLSQRPRDDDFRFVQVTIQGLNGDRPLPSGADTWQYAVEGAGATQVPVVNFVGALCADITTRTQGNALHYDIEVVNDL